MNNYLKEIGARIRNRRMQLHYSQEYLAKLVDVNAQTIAAAEQGKKQLCIGIFYNICIALEISSDYLLFGKEGESEIDAFARMYPFLTREQASDLKSMPDIFVKQVKP